MSSARGWALTVDSIVAPEDLKAAAVRMAARDSHKVSLTQRGGRRMATRESG